MNTVEEIWKSPPSLNRPWIEVSNIGRVRNTVVSHYFSHNGNRYLIKERKVRFRTICPDTRGRPMIMLLHKGRSGNYFFTGHLIARLVAECFVENPMPDAYNFVFHKDGDLTNVKADNLEWGNQIDKRKIMFGKHAKKFIVLYQDATKTEEVGRFRGYGEVARALGITKQSVHQSLRDGLRIKGYYGEIIGSCNPIKRTILDVRQESRG